MEPAEKKVYLPVFLDIRGKHILLVGAGRVAFQKLRMLSAFDVKIRIVSEDIMPEIAAMKHIDSAQKSYEVTDLDGIDIVYACTNNRKKNAQICKDCHARHIIINVADDPALCDFITPALHHDADITVAVSSGGRNLKRTVRVRNAIREAMTHDYIA